MSIGERIKQRRKELGLTLRDISAKTGISSGNLSEIENNKYLPSADKLISLCGVLDCSIDWILIGSSNSRAEESMPQRKISVTEKLLLNLFSKLNEDNQNLVVDFMENVLEKQNQNIVISKSKDTASRDIFFK